MIQDLPFDIARLREAYQNGEAAENVVSECYRRIRLADDPGIFISLRDEADVVAEARALGPFDPEEKPLYGVPFAVKDNIDVAGVPTTAACPAFSYNPQSDAFCVKKLREAGALVIGKTNLDQFATGLVGVRSPYPIPRNAIDPEIVPGGSSSGSAVAVSRGIVSFALGTDTAGSGRVPAALNNIVGLKPTLGGISSFGVVPACRSLDTVSIFSLTVDDAWSVYRTVCAYDAEDAYSRELASPGLSEMPPSLTVGIPDSSSIEFFGDALQAKSFAASVETLRRKGMEIVELDFTPFYDIAKLLYEGPWVAERYAAIRRVIETQPDALLPVTRGIISKAEAFSAANAFEGAYRLKELERKARALLGLADMLCVPTVPTFYSVSDLKNDPVGPNSNLGTYTNFVNLLDLCGIAVPMTARQDGRPGSVTLLGGAGRDAFLASIGAWLHHDAKVSLGATGWGLPEPAKRLPAAQTDEIAVAMVGAHMSGLPLNGEVTRLGGRFLSATRTAPSYRFYSLAGGPPARPGLVRSEEGGSIDLEIWALPISSFGAFMAGIPQPLGIGTIDLVDGTSVKGFLCEPAGLEGAEEITGFGGWRAYLASLN
ncbi:allophanate hydrolase [Hoeflea sp. WL0058]|uniref:Allophanate hydrolase n=1 Tax=Flavimaribacter sediminis TaxID=2865987 RepID=A0AAE3D2J1_9HYPH|nr:allophanate hydrolase [Flavimaribacter sediminis]MBW8639849.1 allophanate hydrolase [Flavimaribacter sediminis]